jgi:hypothetical protein
MVFEHIKFIGDSMRQLKFKYRTNETRCRFFQDRNQ